MAVTKVKQDDFQDQVLNCPIPVIVDFFGKNCGPCRMLSPVFEKISNDYQGKIHFASVDAEENYELSQKMNIKGVPTLIGFSGGKEVVRQVGYEGEKSIEKILTALKDK